MFTTKYGGMLLCGWEPPAPCRVLPLPNTYDVVIVNANYPDTYSDNGTSYSEKSSFYEFRYYSQLCQFYIYKNVSANSTFTNKCIPGYNAGISVLAFNIN